MQNTDIHMCEKFHNDRLRNDRALVLLKSDNNNPQKKHNNNSNVHSACGPVSGSKNISTDFGSLLTWRIQVDCGGL